jgi:putative hydrolase of the HAD superfamily
LLVQRFITAQSAAHSDRAQWEERSFPQYTGAIEGILVLRAVVFDYGMVLTGPPDPAAHAALVRITGLPTDRFDSLYWADRNAFDAGTVTGQGFWRKIAGEAGLNLNESQIEELVHWDARMWMTENAPMLAWQQSLKHRGLRTAIVSNMGDTIHREMQRKLGWLDRFDVLVWSYELHMTKPDPAIYRLVLERLGSGAEETLFIDDRKANVDAALALGMKGTIFSTVEKLRAELAAAGLDSELPMP